jgi:hypothetical protein
MAAEGSVEIAGSFSERWRMASSSHHFSDVLNASSIIDRIVESEERSLLL